MVEGEAGGDAEARVDCHGGGWTVEEPNIWTQGLSQAPVHEGEAEDAHRNEVNNAVTRVTRALKPCKGKRQVWAEMFFSANLPKDEL